MAAAASFLSWLGRLCLHQGVAELRGLCAHLTAVCADGLRFSRCCQNLHSADAAAGPTPAVGPVATPLPCARPRSLPVQRANAAAGPTLLPEPHAAPRRCPATCRSLRGSTGARSSCAAAS